MEEEQQQYKVTYLDDGSTSSYISRGGKSIRVNYENGDVYEGEFSATTKKKHGKGRYIFSSSTSSDDDDDDGTSSASPCKYTGQYVSGMRQGHGTFTFPDGSFYTGQFLWNSFHGLGTYTYSNGDVYSGMWKNGKRSGSGTYVVKSTDSQLVGIWKDSEFVRGTWHLADGTSFEGSLPSIHASPFQGVFRFPHTKLTTKGEYVVAEEDDVKWKSHSIENVDDSVSFPLKDTFDRDNVEKNLRVISFDSNGSVILRNVSEESTVSLLGLSVSLFDNNDEMTSSFTFRDDIDLSPSTHLRLLFDNHATDPPAVSLETNLLDICVKGLKNSSSSDGLVVRFSYVNGDGTCVSLNVEELEKENDDGGDEEEEKKEEQNVDETE